MEIITSKSKAKAASQKESKKLHIEVVAINKPPKEEAQAKIKELSEFLSMAWGTPKNSQ